jgi:CRP-like cAMP-binding protein
MQKNIIEQIRKVVDLDGKQQASISNYTEIQHLKKKELLLQENMICQKLYYVEKGCLRMYFINNKGVEQITQFALEGWWIADYHSFLSAAPSEYYIQAIEESRIISIQKNRLDALLQELPHLEKYFRMMLQKALAGAQLRSKLLYEMSKEEFYVHFSTSFPEFMLRVPQYMIASYLGLTPEYLSELRKKKS